MSDSSAVPSALGIEAVEWIAEGGENLTVRVTGRWRRRRPAWSGKPTLVVEAPGRRYRFPAMPEPPSLSGAGPGMWRISFSVPAALAPELGGRSWLQFGSVAVPLPAAIEPPGAVSAPPAVQSAEAPPPGRAESPAGFASGRPSAESDSESPWAHEESLARRAEEAEAAVSALTGVVRDLERDLASARARADELTQTLDAQRRDRRTAQQREHAERALRLDLARQAAADSREAHRAREAYGDLAAAESRVRELERELDTARRRSDEAEQAAAAAVAARERAEESAGGARREADVAARRLGAAETARLELEGELATRRAAGRGRVPDEPARVAARTLGLTGGPEPGAARTLELTGGPEPASPAPGGPGAEALVGALRAELDLRAGAEAALRARVTGAEAQLGARERLSEETGRVMTALRHELGGLRHELGRLRTALGQERERRLAAEHRVSELERALGVSRARSRDALAAIGEIRGALATLVPPAPAPAPPAAPQPHPEVEPERLNAALARLRERVAEPVGEPAPAPPEPPAPEPERPTAALAPPPAAEPVRAWLEPIFRQLVREDPEGAGRLLIELLPAQRAVVFEPIAYDLVLGADGGVIQVTAGAGRVDIHAAATPRSSDEVSFSVSGDRAELARMIVAGPLRRRFGRDVARTRGRRAGVARTLEALIAARLDLAELHRLGVRLDPRTALTVVAALIDPEQTRKERFALEYRCGGEEVYLLVRGATRPSLTTVRPAGRIAVTVLGPPGSLEQVLGGEEAEDATVSGDEWALALLRKWIKAAQSG